VGGIVTRKKDQLARKSERLKQKQQKKLEGRFRSSRGTENESLSIQTTQMTPFRLHKKRKEEESSKRGGGGGRVWNGTRIGRT